MFWKAYELQEETPCHHTSVHLIYEQLVPAQTGKSCQLHNLQQSPLGWARENGKNVSNSDKWQKMYGHAVRNGEVLHVLHKLLSRYLAKCAIMGESKVPPTMRRQDQTGHVVTLVFSWPWWYKGKSICIYFRGAPTPASSSSTIWRILSPRQCLPQLITELFARWLAFFAL